MTEDRRPCWRDGSCATPIRCYLHGCQSAPAKLCYDQTMLGPAARVARVESPASLHTRRNADPRVRP
jgi:hypothetical protein